MADITKDTYNRANRFFKVLFQRGRKALDFELNEMQDNLRNMIARAMLNSAQVANGNPVLNPGSNDTGWKAVGSGLANQVTISVGTLFVDGIPLENTAAFLTAPGLFTTNPGPGSRTDVLYAAVTEVEVADPNQVPQLGNTTKRRQIQVTLGVSTTGLGGVPANTVAEILAGGVHYFPLASINRPAAQAAINVGDVTDLRNLLPPSLIAQATRQVNFVLTALAATIVETPGIGGNPLPKANLMTMDVDPDDTFGPGSSWQVRFNRDAGFTERPLIVRGTTGGAASSIGSDGTLAFRDANLDGAAVASGSTTAPFSTANVTFGDQFPRLAEIPIHGTGFATPSMLRLLNAPVLTVGDGTHSFGHFSGPTAIFDAFNYINTNQSGASCRIYVKRGVYTMGNAQVVDITNGQDVLIEGEGSGSETGASQVLIQNNCTGSTAPFVVSAGRLTVRNMVIKQNNTSTVGVRGTSNGQLTVERCSFSSLKIAYDGTPFLVMDLTGNCLAVRDCSFLAPSAGSDGECILITTSVGGETRGILVEGCFFQGSNESAIMTIRAGATPTLMSGILFDRCTLNLGGSAANHGAYSNAANNCGPLKLDPNGFSTLTIEDITFRDCEVVAPGTTTTSILLYLRTSTGFNQNIPVGLFRIQGGSWTVSAASDTLPFYIGGKHAMDKPSLVTSVVIEDVVWGQVGRAETYGVSATEAGPMPGSGSGASFFYISADHIRMHNVRWTQCVADSSAGDLTLYQARTYDVDGLILDNWVSGAGGGTPVSRVRVEGYVDPSPNPAASPPTWTGSAGQIRGVLIDGGYGVGIVEVSSYGLMVAVPNGHLVVEASRFSYFENGTQHGIGIPEASPTSVGPPVTLPNDSTGLVVKDCLFYQLTGSGIHYLVTAGTGEGLGDLKVIGSEFNRCGKGIDLDDGGMGASNDHPQLLTVIDCTFIVNTGLGISALLGFGFVGNHVTMKGNNFQNNNGIGIGIVQAQIGRTVPASPVSMSAWGNNMGDATNLLRVRSTGGSPYVNTTGLETGYQAAAPQKVFTDGSQMFHNYGSLKTS